MPDIRAPLDSLHIKPVGESAVGDVAFIEQFAVDAIAFDQLMGVIRALRLHFSHSTLSHVGLADPIAED